MVGRKYRKSYQHVARFLSVFITALVYVSNSEAKPDMKPVGPSIAERGSLYYQFSVSRTDSADGKRHYKVWTGIPNKSPPPSGFPILYMLDGNAVMDRLSENLLKELSAKKTPPVIVAIGYQTTFPFELNARAYDYTPLAQQISTKNVDSGHDGRKTGGSTVFRQLLQDSIYSQVEKNIKVNPLKRGLWGHSYGGLFVIDSYLSSSLFKFYYAASPSFGRGYYELLKKLEHVSKQNFCDKQLYLMDGTGVAEQDIKNVVPDVLQKVKRRFSVLNADGVTAAYWRYPGLTHGEMFNVSFQAALLNIGALSDKNRQSCNAHHFSD